MTSFTGEPVTSHTGDFPFGILRWVSVLFLAGLTYAGAMDALAGNWFGFATSALLVVCVIAFVMRPSFALARSSVTVDQEGVRRKGAWDVRWEEVASARVTLHKDIQYLEVVPKNPGQGTDITRFFVRKSDFARDAYLAPLDAHKAPEVRDAIKGFRSL
ncbi:MAG: hypothetical protein Q4G64_03695 [bacterium]|nr:hypothetical protein [bacterium]